MLHVSHMFTSSTCIPLCTLDTLAKRTAIRDVGSREAVSHFPYLVSILVDPSAFLFGISVGSARAGHAVASILQRRPCISHLRKLSRKHFLSACCQGLLLLTLLLLLKHLFFHLPRRCRLLLTLSPQLFLSRGVCLLLARKLNLLFTQTVS
jgi:hypothetical protein